MIIGAFLRYYKTYQGINYIPITDEDKFCGLVGDNGIGKSSVLESLDTFFNSKSWNFNTITKKSGKSSTKPQIVPVFLLERRYFDGDDLEKAELLNS
ncbi:AAA family ATPase, partial [Pseudoalteromonas atlantica]